MAAAKTTPNDDETPAPKKAHKAPKIGTTGVVTLKDGTVRPATITSDPITRPMVTTDKAAIVQSQEWKDCHRASVHMPGGWVETVVSIDESREIGDVDTNGGFVPAFTAN